MIDQPTNNPEWLDRIEELADEQLGEGSACEQIHPIIESWYSKLLEGDPPTSRDSVAQAMACLSTEILFDTPEELLQPFLQAAPEEDLTGWIEYILLVGRAFEIALRNGDLDDL